MSQRRVQIVILCEDRQQEVFARHFLKKRGFTGRVDPKICPSGSQSGEQYVRTEYPKELTISPLEVGRFFHHGERNRFTLRKHLYGVSHRCKTTMLNYHCSSHVAINYYATLTTLVNPLG